jgi:tRNA(adenine34) deaminase
MITVYNDDYFMRQAIQEAERAADQGEVPVGAVVVCQERIIARAHNQTELLKDVTAHAEILAITAASQGLGGKYLNDCALYITLEPCPMCAGALKWARIGKLVYGAEDEKGGYLKYEPSLLHPSTEIAYGLRRDECAQLLKEFFQSKR